MKPPAFSFYAADFLMGTAAFTLAERGAYITLLCYQWDAGYVPEDPLARSRVLGCSLREADKVWERVSFKFYHLPGGGWQNSRLESERSKQADRRAALAANGARGGRPRKPNGNQKVKQTETNRLSADHKPENQNESLSSSSSFSVVHSERSQSEPHTHAERAGTFSEWYSSKHSEIFGIGYIGNPRKDYDSALAMVAKFTDADLRDAALVWFGMGDEFATSGTRTIPKFASRVTKCVELARRVAS